MFSKQNATTASTAIIVLPVGTARPTYRDALSGPFQPRVGLEKMNFASLLEFAAACHTH